MTTVSTKKELISAIERREKQIIATGEIAASIRRKVKVKKGAKVGGLVLAIGGLPGDSVHRRNFSGTDGCRPYLLNRGGNSHGNRNPDSMRYHRRYCSSYYRGS